MPRSLSLLVQQIIAFIINSLVDNLYIQISHKVGMELPGQMLQLSHFLFQKRGIISYKKLLVTIPVPIDAKKINWSCQGYPFNLRVPTTFQEVF